MQKHTPLTRIEGMPPPTSLGELITADHKILNLDDESKQDHRNALIVQDGARIAYSGILRKQRRTRNCFHSRRQEGSSQTVQWNSSKHVRTCDGRMTRISSSFTIQPDSRKSCSTTKRRNSNSDGSMWLTRSMVGPCEGMLLLLAQRVRQDGRWQDNV